MKPAYVIAFSRQPSVADFLKRVLDRAGFAACAVSSSSDDLEALVQRAEPDAIVFEIGFPFAEHWHQLQEIRSRGALRDVPIVIATGAHPELYRRVGVTTALEIFTRPDDLTEVRTVVWGAIDAAASGRGA